MLKPFTLNDETKKNSHGFFLLNSGGIFDRFDQNPVMLDNHDMCSLVGKWNNRRVEGALLLADPDFDTQTTLGAERHGQVERGYLKGASLGLMILRAEVIDNEVYVTQWDAVEASVTPIPSNAGALQLRIYDNEGAAVNDTQVKSHIDGIVKLCANQSTNNSIINNTMDKTIQLSAEAITALGAQGNLTDLSAISTAIVTLAADRDTYKTKLAAHDRKAAENLVDLAIAQGKATANKRASLVEFALASPEIAKDTFEGISAKQTLSDQVTPIQGKGAIPADRKNWTTLKWLKEDPAEFNRIRREDAVAYEQIKTVGR